LLQKPNKPNPEVPNAETVSKNKKNAISQESWRLGIKALTKFCYRNPINSIQKVPNAETVAKNAQNAIPQRSWGTASETTGELRFFNFVCDISAFGTIRIGFIEFSYGNPINPFHKVSNAETVAKNTKNSIPQRSWRPVSESPGELRFVFLFFETVSAFGTIQIGFIGLL
jgi:hypothetical protein